jgi:hypothetical protein
MPIAINILVIDMIVGRKLVDLDIGIKGARCSCDLICNQIEVTLILGF